MFDQVIENMRKATESTFQVQQEMFKKWVALWPGTPPSTNGGGEQMLKFQKRWMEVVGEQVRKQRETLEAQFNAGLRNLEEAFRLAEAKDPDELRAKTLELWQKTFDCLRQGYEAQMRDFQTVVTKWTELMMKGAA
jgi:hypothetical protein